MVLYQGVHKNSDYVLGTVLLNMNHISSCVHGMSKSLGPVQLIQNLLMPDIFQQSCYGIQMFQNYS